MLIHATTAIALERCESGPESFSSTDREEKGQGVRLTDRPGATAVSRPAQATWLSRESQRQRLPEARARRRRDFVCVVHLLQRLFTVVLLLFPQCVCSVGRAGDEMLLSLVHW